MLRLQATTARELLSNMEQITASLRARLASTDTAILESKIFLHHLRSEVEALNEEREELLEYSRLLGKRSHEISRKLGFL